MDWFEGKTFILTGGAGFIGSHVAGKLLAYGATVAVIDDFNDFYDPRIKEYNVKPYLEHPQFQLFRADIREKETLSAIFEKMAPKVVQSQGGLIHLAARAGVRPSLKQPKLYLETNVMGTYNLVELAHHHHIHNITFASSSSVYGDSPETVPFKETQNVSRPISPYAASKVMGENFLHSYSHLYGLIVKALRFFTVYGAAQRPDLAIHKFTRLIDEGTPIPVYGDGSTQRDYTYIDDIVQGVLAAIQYQETPFEIFNLGESHTTTLKELIELIEEALGKRALIDPHPLQPGDVPITYADISKSQKILHYHPTTKPVEGIPKFVAWYINYKKLMASG